MHVGTSTSSPLSIRKPPTGLAALALVGPAFVWCAEYIGSGEVILATRSGAILGVGVIWAVIAGVFLKYWIGMSGARYTATTGEGMIDMFARMPGPRHWAVWVVLVAQFAAGTISIGSIASAGGIFLAALTSIPPFAGAWLISFCCLAIVWSGTFDVLKVVMSVFILLTVVGVFYVAIVAFPGAAAFTSALRFAVPEVPAWATARYGINPNPWREILPLLGWGAGGFASQVWYTYWVLGAGYGAAEGRPYGVPADVARLKTMGRETAERIRGWCRVVYLDASIAMIIGITVTSSFLIAGAGILRPGEAAPAGTDVAMTLSSIFSSQWGALGGVLFLISGAAAMISTQIGLLAGWPRLLADASRICIPGVAARFTWTQQFRFFLIFFLVTNLVISYTLGYQPVALVQTSAILDGLLLTPLQALWVGLGLYYVLPRLLSDDAREILRPHWIFAVGLALAFLVFGYFCVVQIPLAIG